jgi:hypothetical protein
LTSVVDSAFRSTTSGTPSSTWGAASARQDRRHDVTQRGAELHDPAAARSRSRRKHEGDLVHVAPEPAPRAARGSG